VTVEEVNVRVAAIEAVSGDDEGAHAREDELHQNVLRAIALGAENPQGLASAALKSLAIDFERWCA
jgi:hypothetical protein